MTIESECTGKANARRFVAADGTAEVAAIVVTYNSGADLPGLLASVRAETVDVRIRLIVADNGSSDGTVRLLASEPDIITVDTGGNLGYAGGINAAIRLAGDAEAILVLNPDLVVEPGGIRILLERMRREGAGVVVPRLAAPDGSTSRSLRREPSISRALGDALFGSRLRGRPRSLSEIEDDPRRYETSCPIEWATGAALLTSSDVAQAIGDWDERFFLYSEEVDYFRRARAAHASAWFEPAATMRHTEGGSGTSPELAALMAVNRVRYVEKHHRAVYAAIFRSVVILHEALRSRTADHRLALRILLERSSWESLPHATRW